MTTSKLPSSFIRPEWKDAGYHKGAELDYSTLSIGAARPTTISDIRDAIDSPSVKTVILPQGDISIDGILEPKRSVAILGHENGTNIKWTKSLYELFGIGTFLPDPAEGKLGWATGGGHIWNKTVKDLTEVIVARMTMTYPSPSKYNGHWKETGRNPVFLYEVDDFVIQDITVIDGDNGIMFHGNRGTVRNITLKNTSSRTAFFHNFSQTNTYSHYGINPWGSQNCLIQNLDLQTTAIHDIFFGGKYNVFTGLKGKNLSLDHHHAGPSYNLIDNVNHGLATRPWKASSRADRTNMGQGNVFWNLRTGANKRLSTLPPPEWWLNLGINAPKKYAVVGHTQTIKNADTWVEAIGLDLEPVSLYQALKSGTFPPVTPPTTNKFKVGDRVRVKTDTGYVRAIPGVSNPKLGTQPLGSLGTIIDGPRDVSGDDFIWYCVNYDNQPDGWTGQGSLELA